MKLNQDCIRDVMLYIESNAEFGTFIYLKSFLDASELSKYDNDTIKYTLGKLDETGYLKSSCQWIDNNVYSFSTGMITWEGHKFLDTIRDTKIWSKTKQITSKFSSVSVSMVENIASQVISTIVQSQMTKNGLL